MKKTIIVLALLVVIAGALLRYAQKEPMKVSTVEALSRAQEETSADMRPAVIPNVSSEERPAAPSSKNSVVPNGDGTFKVTIQPEASVSDK